MSDVLQFTGFSKANIFSEDVATDIHKLTIFYDVDSRESLHEYFDKHAANMRQQTIDKFGDKVKAQRRVLEFRQQMTK